LRLASPPARRLSCKTLGIKSTTRQAPFGMNALATTPQPLHEMVPVLLVLSFLLLAAVSLIARVFNWVAKKPVLNGSYLVLLLLLLSIAALTALSLFHPKVSLYGSRILGQGTAALVPAAVVSLILGRRFSRKKQQARQGIAGSRTQQGTG
jgi:glucan phosphoethanolaminetransferase (alkaline phosphatase superfamily)